MNNPSTCPHFSLCSGCELPSDIDNPPIWRSAQLFFKNKGIDAELICDGFERTRLKAKLAVDPDGKLGLFKKHTHDVIPIPDCLIHHEAINKASSILRTEIIRQNLSIYSEKSGLGLVRYVQFFVERETDKVQLTVVVNQSKITPDLQLFCQSLLKYDLWHSIWINFHPKASNTILGRSWELFNGSPFLWQTLNQTPIPFHPGAFSQVHLSLFEKMLQKIESWVKPNEKVIELYAGVGAIGLTLLPKTQNITLVENNPLAHLSFQQAKKEIPYQCIDAKDAVIDDQDLIIVDPPRKGLDPLLLDKIAQLEKGRLIYVSCGFESFQRDCDRLLGAGWKIEEAQGYLLFPGTNHVETLTLLYK